MQYFTSRDLGGDTAVHLLHVDAIPYRIVFGALDEGVYAGQRDDLVLQVH